MEILNIIIGILGAVGGISGLIALYKAKPEKTSLELQNLELLLQTARDERNSLIKENNEFKEATDLKIERLDTKIEQLQSNNNLLNKAINCAYRCKAVETILECPVIIELTDKNNKRI